MYVYRRGLELIITELYLAPHQRLPAETERYVCRGAAHIEGQDVGDFYLTRQVSRARDAPGRPREGYLDRTLRHGFRAHRPAVRPDDAE